MKPKKAPPEFSILCNGQPLLHTIEVAFQVQFLDAQWITYMLRNELKINSPDFYVCNVFEGRGAQPVIARDHQKELLL